MKKNIEEVAKAWLPMAVAITIVSGLVFAAVQQNYRLTANDPQIQIVEDVSGDLENGATADQIVPPTGSTDISKSLSAFVIIYDESGKPLGSTAILDGQTPVPPSQVFDSVKASGEERLTWQPKDGVRVATVIKKFGGPTPGFILAGRSLREIENRIGQMTILVIIGWAAALIISLLIKLLLSKKPSTHTETPEQTTNHL